MYKKHKVPCPQCHAFKLVSWSPAGLSLTLLLGSVITVCIPVLGWILIIPIALADIVLISLTVVLYMIPTMRQVTVRCRQCDWKANEDILPTLKPQTAS
jgi:hypothetical protein